MGIIVLAIAILPFLGIGGLNYFQRSSGPASDKLHPRITDTAKRLWLIYLLTLLFKQFLFIVLG